MDTMIQIRPQPERAYDRRPTVDVPCVSIEDMQAMTIAELKTVAERLPSADLTYFDFDGVFSRSAK